MEFKLHVMFQVSKLKKPNNIMLIAIYVDGLLLAGSDIDCVIWVKGELN